VKRLTLDGSTTDHGPASRDRGIVVCGLKLPGLGLVGGTVRVSTSKHSKHTKKRQMLKFANAKVRMELDIPLRGELIVGVD
jgi:hypothetical protein